MTRFGIFRNWVAVIGVNIVCMLLPVLPWNPYKPSQQTQWDKKLDGWKSNQWVNEYALVRPFQLWPNVTVNYFLELEDMTNFDCPRVYYPTCATNGVTYVNACIMHALKQTFKRFGPCLIFRRNENEKTAIVVPKKWRTNKTEFENIKKNFKYTKENIMNMLSKLTESE
ncbi:kazal-type serine protease inhibitor domain-containing protein [Phthorimaea operculella]|nr:kazal-type serine protease inhibitor domain-containing protein [Phthorimaea operculella]